MTDISALLIGALDATGTKMGDAGIAVIVGELKNHPPADVRTALSRCARESHGFLTLSDILERIPRAANHVPTNPDEAWTMAVSLVGQASEASTIVAPEAILAAFPHALWNQGDEVAARMAFKAGYPAVVAKHGNRWGVSDGHDSSGREVAILEAVRDGRLSAKRGRALLPHLPDETFAVPTLPALAGVAR